jgi:hypothetical protein
MVQSNIDKIYALDTEVKLLKGVILSLNGTGDGSTGSVPRLEAGMSALRSEVGGLRSDVTSIKDAVDKLTAGAGDQKAWTDGWKGVAVALGVIGTCLTIMGTLVAGAVWLFQHGGTR